MRVIGMPYFSGKYCLLISWDRAKIVIYDLEKHVRFTVTQDWDRSPSELAVSFVFCKFSLFS